MSGGEKFLFGILMIAATVVFVTHPEIVIAIFGGLAECLANLQ